MGEFWNTDNAVQRMEYDVLNGEIKRTMRRSAKDMSRMEEAVDEMAAYVCDKVCRYGTDGSLDQKRLDGICAECEMGNHVCHVLNEYNRITEGMGNECNNEIPRK